MTGRRKDLVERGDGLGCRGGSIVYRRQGEKKVKEEEMKKDDEKEG